MPYQNMPLRSAMNEKNDVSRASAAFTVARGLMRDLLVRDLRLKLLALAITIGIWFGVTVQRAPATVRVRGVQLSFRVPGNMEISNDPRAEVDLTLSGSQPALARLSGRDLAAQVDLSDYNAGEHVVQLTPGRITVDLPEGIHIENVIPNKVPVRLDPRLDTSIEVEARFDGHLPPGYELRGVTITPGKIRVAGPSSHVLALQKAPTESISLDGLTSSRTLPHVPIDISDQKIDVIDAEVSVDLDIREQGTETTNK